MVKGGMEWVFKDRCGKNMYVGILGGKEVKDELRVFILGIE